MFKASDFAWLILNPDTALNSPNILKTFGREVRGCDIVSITSSAYRATLCGCSPICIPVMFGLRRICAARGSIHKAKSRGDRGQPCLVPL
ncbi:hypothetical protein FKM82_030589 [Ascaphus truei]